MQNTILCGQLQNMQYRFELAKFITFLHCGLQLWQSVQTTDILGTFELCSWQSKFCSLLRWS